jgi:hypothetical protein
MTEVIECLPKKQEILNSNPCISKYDLLLGKLSWHWNKQMLFVVIFENKFVKCKARSDSVNLKWIRWYLILKPREHKSRFKKLMM